MKIKAFGVITLLVFLDQLSKFLVRYFHLPFTLNTGISFGFFADASWLIIAVLTIACLLGLIFWLVKYQDGKGVVFWCIVFWLAGGIGNLIDRIFYRAAFDFIYLYQLPIFNFADVMISLGFCLFLLQRAFDTKKKIKLPG